MGIKLRVSFLLPLYNVCSYLKESIASIVNSMDGAGEYEIICVDDCSTDGTYEVAETLLPFLPMFRLYRNDVNRGIGFTRQRLLELAAGEYICFVDPDDILDPRACGLFLNALDSTNAAYAIGDFRRFDDGTSPNFDDTPGTACRQIVLDGYAYDYSEDGSGGTMGGVWAIMYRRSFLADNELRFNEDLRHYEDMLFTRRVQRVPVRKVRLSGEVVYWYRIRGGVFDPMSKRREINPVLRGCEGASR